MWKGNMIWLGLALAACGSETAPPVGAVETAQTPPVAQETFQLEGRVVDPWGDPVNGVEVRVLPAGAAEDGQALATTRSDDSGNYSLELTGPGPYRIFARHESRGVDRITSAPLESGAVNRALDLRLAGEGRFAGHLLDTAGQPVVGNQVSVYRRELLHEELFRNDERFDLEQLPLWAPMLDSPRFIAGEGFQYLMDVTDASGAFHFKGLVPGEYIFFSSAIGPRPWLALDREWYRTGNEEIELRSTLCMLEVAVGLDGLPGSITGKEANRRRLGKIEVFPGITTNFGARPILRRSIASYGNERNVFALEPGEYFVRAETFPPKGFGGGTMHVEGLIRLEPGDSLRRINLEFPPVDRPTGRLRVSAEVPDGWDQPTQFHLLSALTIEQLECSEATPYPSMVYDQWLDVPEGEYILALFPFKDFVGRPEVVDLARCYRRVRVVAGEEVECVLRAVPGGRVRLALGADPFVLGNGLSLLDGMSEPQVRDLLNLFEQTIGVVITIVREDEGPALPLRLKDKLARLTSERRAMLPGEVMENFLPLDPGNYRIWAQAPGFEPASVPVTIVGGQTVKASLDLKARR